MLVITLPYKLWSTLMILLLNNVQLAYLEDWTLLERDHSTSFTGAINDL